MYPDEICKMIDSSGSEGTRAKANAKFLFWYGYAGNEVLEMYPVYLDTADMVSVSIIITHSSKQFMNAGDTKQFTASLVINNFKNEFDEIVPAIDIEGKSFKWKLDGNSSKDTVITPEGQLTLGADEENSQIYLHVQYQEKGMKCYKVMLRHQSGTIFDYSNLTNKVSFLDDKRNAYYFSMKETNNSQAPYMVRNICSKSYYYSLDQKVDNGYESQLYYDSKDGYYTYYYSCCKLKVTTGSGVTYDDSTGVVKIKVSPVEKATGTITITPTFSSSEYGTTDKVKVYALGS